MANLTVICVKCLKSGKLENNYNHSCTVAQEITTGKKCQIVTVVTPTRIPPKEQELIQAAILLRDKALGHKRGDPIPYAIEQATYRWTWMKLQQGDKVASLKTGGKVHIHIKHK